MRHIYGEAMALILCVIALAEAAAGSYRFENIVDTATPAPVSTFSGFEFPAVDNGIIAFRGTYEGGRSGIFTSNGADVVTIALDARGFHPRLSRLSTANGLVTFGATFGDPGSGIFFGDGGPLTTVAKTGDPVDSVVLNIFPYAPSYSNGTVAFQSVYLGGNGVFTADGTLIQAIAKVGDSAPVGTFTALSSPVIDGARVGFAATYADSIDAYSGIVVHDYDGLTKVVQTGDAAPSGVFLDVAKPSLLGDAIAFRGTDGGGAGIFYLNQLGQISAIVREGDAAPVGVFKELSAFAVGESEVVYFGHYGELNISDYMGIFVSRDGQQTPLIKTGDQLFGSTVVALNDPTLLNGNIENYTFGLDQHGNGGVAFVYLLEDGRKGVALAVRVPEPSSLALGLIDLFLLIVPRQIKRARAHPCFCGV